MLTTLIKHPLYITHCILTPYRPPTPGLLTAYPWYKDPFTHGILIPLPMAYRPTYPWYIEPPTQGISTPYP